MGLFWVTRSWVGGYDVTASERPHFRFRSISQKSQKPMEDFFHIAHTHPLWWVMTFYLLFDLHHSVKKALFIGFNMCNFWETLLGS